jgi:NADPH2:quinone reductase
MKEDRHDRAMRAVVLDAPGPPEALEIHELPIPEARPGCVLIQGRC